MRFMANFRMRKKLALLLVVPLAGLFYFAASGTSEKIRVSREMSDLKNMSMFAVKTSNVIHELQGERGESTLYLASKGTKFKTELQKEIDDTDRSVGELKNFLGASGIDRFGPDVKKPLESALTDLDTLKAKRDSIRSLKIPADEGREYYTKIISSFIHAVSNISLISTNSEMSAQISAYVNLIRMKERAGQERALLGNVFTADRFGPGMLNKVIAVIAEQDTYASVFLSFATSEQEDIYKNKLADPTVDEAMRMRKIALQKAATGRLGVNPGVWYKAQTGRMDALKEVIDRLSSDIQHKADKLNSAAKASLIFFVTLVIAITALSLVTGYFIAKGITTPLGSAVYALNRLAEGDTTVKIDIGYQDEIGMLLKAMDNMVGSINKMADAASAIASGNLKVDVVPQSERDVLGNALADMVESLRKQTREISDGINVIASSAGQISVTTAQLSTGAVETATSISETTTTLEEVKQTAHVSNQKARHVSDSSQNALQISQKGSKSVEETIGAMNHIMEQMESIASSIVKLSEQSQAIGEIISSVNDITAQSNLLAVNAAIEAARAGEQGKGFTVVAHEIGSLAKQSREATAQIQNILNDIQKAIGAAVMTTERGSKAVENGVRQSRESGEAIQMLTDSIAGAAQAATQIAASSQQQLVGMDQVAIAMENIKQASTQNVEGAQQLETAAGSLSDLGQKLKQLIERYKV